MRSKYLIRQKKHLGVSSEFDLGPAVGRWDSYYAEAVIQDAPHVPHPVPATSDMQSGVRDIVVSPNRCFPFCCG